MSGISLVKTGMYCTMTACLSFHLILCSNGYH